MSLIKNQIPYTTFFSTSLLVSFLFLSTTFFSLGCNRKQQEVQIKPPPKVHVQTEPVTIQKVPSLLQVTGNVEALYQTDLAANATGKVLEVHMETGDEVKKGEILAKLDVKLVGLQAEAARGQVELARRQAALQTQECERLSKLIASQSVARAEYERQLGQCKIAQGSLMVSSLQAAVAAQAVIDGTIRAPFDGFIVERLINVGGAVTPSTKVATLVSLHPLLLKVIVPEVHLPQLKKGLSLTFRVAPYKERPFTAKLVRISPIIRTTTRDVLVEAEVENKENLLHPGMFAKIELPLGEVEMPVIAKSAVFIRDEAKHLFVVQNGRIEERVVQVGASFDHFVSISKGLSQGEQVVVAPSPEVKNGFMVD